MNKYQHKPFKWNKCDHPILNSIHLNIIEIWNILNSTFSLNVNNEKYGCSEIIQVIRIQYTKIVCASKSGLNHLLFMNIKSIYEISIQIRWNLNNSDAECFELCKKTWDIEMHSTDHKSVDGRIDTITPHIWPIHIQFQTITIEVDILCRMCAACAPLVTTHRRLFLADSVCEVNSWACQYYSINGLKLYGNSLLEEWTCMYY